MTRVPPSDPVRTPEPTGRRAVLKAAGLAGVGAAAAVALPGQTAAIDAPADEAGGRYRLNEHVRRFYALNRL